MSRQLIEMLEMKKRNLEITIQTIREIDGLSDLENMDSGMDEPNVVVSRKMSPSEAKNVRVGTLVEEFLRQAGQPVSTNTIHQAVTKMGKNVIPQTVRSSLDRLEATKKAKRTKTGIGNGVTWTYVGH